MPISKNLRMLAAAPLLSIGLAGVSLLDGEAHAQALEEIVVTARKREEQVLDVPLAVSALTAERIQSQNLQSLVDMQSIAPGFYMSEMNAARNERTFINFVMRGMNRLSAIAAGDGALLFVDGAPVISGQLITFQNAERMEVLRGPQTAYFGRNTFSGALNMVTKTPGFEWGGDLGLQYDLEGSTEVSLSVEGPLVDDRLSFRLSGLSRDFRGTWKNNWAGGRLGDRKTDAISLTLYGQPTEALSIKAFAEYGKFRDGPGASFSMAAAEFGDCDVSGDGTIDWWCGSLPSASSAGLKSRTGNAGIVDKGYIEGVIEPFSMLGPKPLYDGAAGLGMEQLSTHVKLDWDLPWNGISLSAIGAYHDSESQVITNGLSDVNGLEITQNTPCTPILGPCTRTYTIFQTLVERRSTDRYVELRLQSDADQRLRWIGGASYVDAEAVGSNVASEFFPLGYVFFSNTGTTNVETLGVFGGLTFDVSNQLTLSAEIRRQSDDVTQSLFLTDLQTPPWEAAPLPPLQRSFDSTAGRLTVQYRPTDDMNVFVNVANGFRPGTFNGRLLTFPPAVVAQLTALGAELAVDEEELQQVEAGIKGRFMDGRAQGSLVAYTGRIKDMQVANLVELDFGTGVTTLTEYVTSAGRASIRGLEFEGSAQLSENWRVDANAAWNETELKEFTCGRVCRDYGLDVDTAAVGNQFANAPEYTGSLAAMYMRDIQLRGVTSWYLRGEYIYESTKYATEANLAGTGTRNVVNLRTGLDLGEATNVELWVTNLFDDLTYVGLQRSAHRPSGSQNALALALPDQRRFGVRVNHRF